MSARRRLRPDDCLVVAAPRARCDVHEGHPRGRMREAARGPDEAREGGEREGGEGGKTPVKRGPSAAANATTAAESTAYLLENLTRILAVERSKEIGESVDILTSAKKLFVYGVGRSGLAARAFAMRMVQLGIDCYFLGETISPVGSDGEAVLLVSNPGLE